MKTLIMLIIALLALACKAQDKNSIDPCLSLNQVIDSFKIDKNEVSVLIDKSDYRLYVRVDDKIIKEYPVVFGKKDNDDKLMQGDKCTPEGKFKMLSNIRIRNGPNSSGLIILMMIPGENITRPKLKERSLKMHK